METERSLDAEETIQFKFVGWIHHIFGRLQQEWAKLNSTFEQKKTVSITGTETLRSRPRAEFWFRFGCDCFHSRGSGANHHAAVLPLSFLNIFSLIYWFLSRQKNRVDVELQLNRGSMRTTGLVWSAVSLFYYIWLHVFCYLTPLLSCLSGYYFLCLCSICCYCSFIWGFKILSSVFSLLVVGCVSWLWVCSVLLPPPSSLSWLSTPVSSLPQLFPLPHSPHVYKYSCLPLSCHNFLNLCFLFFLRFG